VASVDVCVVISVVSVVASVDVCVVISVVDSVNVCVVISVVSVVDSVGSCKSKNDRNLLSMNMSFFLPIHENWN
jgi:hypothetical protein